MWDMGRTRSRSSEPRFRPRIGREFDLEDVHVIDAKTRGFLSRAIAIGAGGTGGAGGAGGAVVATGGYCLATGNYGGIDIVWAVAGPMFGAMVTHYVGSARKEIR